MTRSRVLGAVVALAALLVLSACAEKAGAGSPAPSSPGPDLADGLVLQVGYTGGFVTPEITATRLPLVSIYSDGRVVTEGPVIAIYPGPALPNVLVQRIDESAVRALVDRALAAGVAETADLGTPPLADAPNTRFTLRTADQTYVREVYALSDGSDEGLTEEQVAGRQALLGLLDALTGAGGDAPAEPYAPGSVAVVTRPWADTDVDPELPQPDVAWPGPALPGEPLSPQLGLGCVTATGPEATAVLQAAAAANARTPWVAADGSRWALTFRPLLPHETGCADLSG
ncbi:hypothetical protein [Blastococcus sp. SYSU D00820]